MKIRSLSWLMIGGVISAVLIYGGVLLVLTWPISELSISSSGVFGDSFGVLTSLFSGLAFAGLIITIVMQRDELALQRQELNLTREELSGQKEEMRAQNETLKVQRFENTFFKMLEFLENCRNDVFYQGFQRPPLEGRDAIKALYDAFTEGFLCNWVQDSSFNQKRVFKEECKIPEGISEEYSNFYIKYGDELGQYYRTLYNLLKLVDRADFIDDKTVYTNLVRAQLSRYELLLLFYNCISMFGVDKMAPLIKKYNVLKHLESTMLPEENIEIWDTFNA
ncbi:putative phage abortive infection protein [Shewanella mangrovisoli]|uniref:putative phage abortive infection protein n=1 Tax=Shewanella mangrovisoli TaxID=2864211 RepID=UPI0035BA2FE3